MESDLGVLEEDTPVITYSLYSPDRPVADVILEAFLAADISVCGFEKTLEDQVETDAINGFDWGENSSLLLSFVAWEYHFVVTSFAVRIYEEPPRFDCNPE